MLLRDRAIRAAHQVHAEHDAPDCATPEGAWRDCLTCAAIVQAVTDEMQSWRDEEVRANK